jgi:hypothetical protein
MQWTPGATSINVIAGGQGGGSASNQLYHYHLTLKKIFMLLIMKIIVYKNFSSIKFLVESLE